MPYKILPFIKATQEEEQEGIIKGYGSTFGGAPDSYGDVIDSRAFEETIKANGRGGQGFAMLWQHDHAQPMGAWTSVSTNSKGLKIEGPVEIESDIGKHRHALLKMGAVKGLSIGFDYMRDSKGRVASDAYEDRKDGTRLIKRISLWEISPVTFAANTRATITGVKSLSEAKTERELERILRDSGISKTDSIWLASMCKSGLRDSGADDQLGDLLTSVQGTAKEMKDSSILNNLLTDLKSVHSSLII